jgi:lipopolysaccharide/colanic/teichoic acid biosynthesis glycosyltransferase
MTKRAFDFIIALVALICLTPFLVLIALLVRMRLGSPVLFVQERAGQHGKPFRMYKFRTMTDGADAVGQLLPDAERLTPFGRFLRASSLDELPELWNIVKGEMSLVGPRPLLIRYLPRYNPDQARRHLVRPGLTGLAQISGRNTLSWEEKLSLDTWYVDHRSFRLDLQILLRTVSKAFDRHGINADDSATMPEFMGAPVPGKPDSSGASPSPTGPSHP